MTGSVRKRGNKWYYSFEMSSVDGKRKRVERSGGDTKKEAEKALRMALMQYENAGLHFEPTEISFADFITYWLENDVKLNCQHSTYESHRLISKNHLIPALGSYKLKSITPIILQELINNKYLSGFSKHYLENMKSTLTASLKYAVHPMQYLKENPSLYIKMPKYQHVPTEHKVISDEDYRKITARFPQGNPFYVMISIGYFSGCRIGEVTALTWEDIDLVDGYISINKSLKYRNDINTWYLGITKTKSSVRKIKIGTTLINILKAHRKWQMENQLKYGEYYINYAQVSKTLDNKEHLCIFRNDSGVHGDPLKLICTKESGEILTTNSFKYPARVIKYELGINFNFHALRHTHATKLIENNANIKGVQERLGHSKIATTMDTYVHNTKKLEEDTADIFEKSTQKNNDLPTLAK